MSSNVKVLSAVSFRRYRREAILKAAETSTQQLNEVGNHNLALQGLQFYATYCSTNVAFRRILGELRILIKFDFPRMFFNLSVRTFVSPSFSNHRVRHFFLEHLIIKLFVPF